MVSTVLDVYNAALSACHAKGRVTSLLEETRERQECTTWYDVVIKTVQEAAHWPSSRSVEYLALQDTRDFNADWTEDNAMPEYKFKYSIPTDYLRAWNLTTFARFDVVYDEDALAITIHTNQENAAMVYSRYQSNPALWTQSQRLAAIYGLAAHIAGPLTGRGEIVQKNVRLANELLLNAQAASMSSPQRQMKALPAPIAARGYDEVHFEQHRFYYPFGGVFSLGETQ